MPCYPPTVVFSSSHSKMELLLVKAKFAGPRISWEKWLNFVTSGAREGLRCLNLYMAAKNLGSIRNKLENVNMFH